MNNRLVWNMVYSKRNAKKPWMRKNCVSSSIHHFSEYIPVVEQGELFDFGCGIGTYFNFFKSKGYKITGTDISDIAISILKKKHKDCYCFSVEKPADLDNITKKYDIVFCWSVFHHINPDEWMLYLLKLSKIAKEKGRFIIGGWDKEGIGFSRKRERISQFTNTKTWAINAITDDLHHFSIIKDDYFNVNEPYSKIERKYRMIVMEN